MNPKGRAPKGMFSRSVENHFLGAERHVFPKHQKHLFDDARVKQSLKPTEKGFVCSPKRRLGKESFLIEKESRVLSPSR